MGNDKRIEELEAELRNAKKRIEDLQDLRSINYDFKKFSIAHSEKENLKDSVLDNLHYPLIILDSDLRVIFANKIYKKTFSLKGDHIEGQFIYDLAEKQWDIPALRKVLGSIIPSGSTMYNFELRYDFGRLKQKYLCLNAKKINLEISKNDYILLSIEDITKRKKAEIKLEGSEQRFHEMIYSSPYLVAIFKGPDHIIEVANDAIKQVWGKGDDVLGRPLLEVIPELKDQGIKELLDNVYTTGEPFHADELPVQLLINGQLETRYFDFTYQAQRNSDGEIIGVADIASDVTKQALLNKQIKKNEREFRELINLMPHKIIMTDAYGNPTFYNDSWLDYADKTYDEFLSQSYIEIIHPEDRSRVSKEVQAGLKDGVEVDVELRILDKHGNYQWHMSKAIPVKDEDGKITSWISSSTQIQKIKEDEKRKEDFLKLVSHELKTPVTSIKGYVQLLLAILKNNDEASTSLPVKPYLNRIETQVERLIRLISEMLDLSRIEQNELELKIEKFNLNKHVEEIVEDLTYSNKDVKIALEHNYDCEVFADKGRIGQVIINFVTNALKYSPDSNQVNIKIYDYENDHVAVCIKDFGIGISEKEQHQIFKRFYRVAGNKDDTYSGFGIGLYLSNEIIDRHKGKIFVKSEVGRGSEFTFTIPINQN